MTLIEVATKKFQSQDIFWSVELVAHLETKSIGKALSWSTSCVKTLIENIVEYKKNTLESYLDELVEDGSMLSFAELMNRANQIWCEERDIPHTALSQLYAARAYLSQSDKVKYHTAVIRASNLMSTHEFFRDSNLTVMFALFNKHEAE